MTTATSVMPTTSSRSSHRARTFVRHRHNGRVSLTQVAPTSAQPALRDDQPVRCVQHRRRIGDQLAAPPPPHNRVQEVPAQDRQRRPRASRRAPRLRQLRNAQEPGDSSLAGAASPLPHPLHADILKLDRAVVRLPHPRPLLRRSDHRSVQALEKDIRNWVTAWNENPRPFIWAKSAEQILESRSRLLQRINGGGHLGVLRR
jgi:hypothetical protein